MLRPPDPPWPGFREALSRDPGAAASAPPTIASTRASFRQDRRAGRVSRDADTGPGARATRPRGSDLSRRGFAIALPARSDRARFGTGEPLEHAGRLVAVETLRGAGELPDVSLDRIEASGFASDGGARPDVCGPDAPLHVPGCLRLARDELGVPSDDCRRVRPSPERPLPEGDQDVERLGRRCGIRGGPHAPLEDEREQSVASTVLQSPLEASGFLGVLERAVNTDSARSRALTGSPQLCDTAQIDIYPRDWAFAPAGAVVQGEDGRLRVRSARSGFRLRAPSARARATCRVRSDSALQQLRARREPRCDVPRAGVPWREPGGAPRPASTGRPRRQRDLPGGPQRIRRAALPRRAPRRTRAGSPSIADQVRATAASEARRDRAAGAVECRSPPIGQALLSSVVTQAVSTSSSARSFHASPSR